MPLVTSFPYFEELERARLNKIRGLKMCVGLRLIELCMQQNALYVTVEILKGCFCSLTPSCSRVATLFQFVALEVCLRQ